MKQLPCKTSKTARRATQVTLGVTAAAALWAALRARSAPPTHHRPIVLITGGGSGIGLELARQYGRRGARLILVGRTRSRLEHAEASLLAEADVRNPADILLLTADLSQRDQAAHMIEVALGHLERIDVLINCAGVIEVGPVENQPIEAFEKAMSNNFWTACYTIHAALPHLLTQKDFFGRRASVVNICSIGGKMAVPHLLPYTASKFALTGLSEGLHAELRSKGIRVTTVCPGLMRTGGEDHAKFVGDVSKEKAWFDFGAKTPVIAASVQHAARRILHAQQHGTAEITITPQAWLAARLTGLAPGLVANLSSVANQHLLPAPLGTTPTAIHSA